MAFYDQVVSLDNMLAEFKADQRVDWQVGKMANAMLEQAKQQIQGNTVIDAIEPFKPGPNDVYIANAQAGTVRAVLGQLMSVLPTDVGL